MTLLELINSQSIRSGLGRVPTATGSTDNRALQLIALLEEEGNDLAARHTWQGLTQEAIITTKAQESQGKLSTLAPGFSFIKNQTFWDRTEQLPIIGPLSDLDWQSLKARTNTGPRFQYRIRGDELLSNPVPAVGSTWAFEYQSNNWILDIDGVTRKSSFTSDQDTFLLPDHVLLLGLRWRWLAEKGLNYSEVFAAYEMQVKDAMSRDGGGAIVYSDGGRLDMQPGIFVPSGSWGL